MTRQRCSIHVVFFFLFINQTISFAMLWASIIRSARTAQISATLWVLCMAVIAWTAWGTGNVFNADTVPEGLKTFITLWPIWGFFRGWGEFQEFASDAAIMGSNGLRWSDVNTDQQCGMKYVLASMALEWPLFLLVSIYLDQVHHFLSANSNIFDFLIQVLDSGHRIPRHPLFFLNWKGSQVRGQPAYFV